MSLQKSNANEGTSSGGRRGNCHQCHKVRDNVVRCTKCQKNYCSSCIARWYPRMEKVSLAEACPDCRNICNCAACLDSYKVKKDTPVQDLQLSTEDKIQFFRYILAILVPFLKKFVFEQNMERAEEARTQGLPITGLQLPEATYSPKEPVRCNNCRTSVFDIHRSCVNCLYKLCITCCQEIRDVFRQGNGQSDMAHVGTSEWKWMANGTITCPPENMGGCGHGDLILNSIYSDNWLSQLLWKAEALDKVDKHIDPLEVSQEACSCSTSYLDCPTAAVVGKHDLQHFRWHLKEGEPMIVPDVLSGTSGLSWEPLVMRRICRKARATNLDDQHFTVQNCLNRREEKIEMLQFCKGYTQGLFDNEGRHQILRLEDWPPSQSFEERLPRHCAEFFKFLPFKQYTHPHAEMPLKIPEISLKTNMGPKMYVSYGVPQELGFYSVTKLQCARSDRVNILVHTAEVKTTRVAHSIINERTNEKAKNDRQWLEDPQGGAIWDVFRRQDVHKLEEYLSKHYGEFSDISSQQVVPIHEKTFYLTEEHKRKLKQEYGIVPWTFAQRLGDAIIIPAGCIHQIRNLKSCTSIAANFVSPESVGECIRLSAKLRSLPLDNQLKDDNLEVKKITVQPISEAVEYLIYVTLNTTSTSTSNQNGADPPSPHFMKQDCERLLLMLQRHSYLLAPAMKTTSTNPSRPPHVAPMAGDNQGGANPPSLQFMRHECGGCYLCWNNMATFWHLLSEHM